MIVVLDFGGQYSQLIARRIRELNVYSLLVPYDVDIEKLKALKPKGVILSGGPASVNLENAIFPHPGVFDLGVPMLGICYGHQLIAKMLGGDVNRTGISEYGKAELEVLGKSALFEGTPKKQVCWMSHMDSVTRLPEGFVAIARTEVSEIAAFQDVRRRIFGVQFHPEVKHTEFGLRILKNFARNICRIDEKWRAEDLKEVLVGQIRAEVGEGRAICALSGGVDSSLAALLAHMAIGDRLTCIFVDHGLLRKGEAAQVVSTFKEKFGLNLVAVEASERFLAKLRGVVDPELKRKIVGEEFIRVFEREARKLGNVEYLVQGTLYSDVIESGGRDAARIKSHHNVAGLPADMKFKLVEPLRNMFKDEARRLALSVGLPEEIVWRHPFPGPGLAIRIVGEVTEEKLSILREADAIVEEEVKKAGLYRKLWQCFAVLLSIKSVGVMGDERSYSYPIVIRAVESEDAMTASWARMPFELLERMSRRIVNEVRGVNRVVYDISSKPPSTIEWE